ncbi:MAG: hypothetical protein ABI813_03630 [Bacteroidota bacterium]
MKFPEVNVFFKYMYDNFIANFIGFVIGMATSRLVSHFFVTRSIKNLWGLAARKTVIDKKTFSNLELMISVIIGFIVFEVLSKWIKKKMEQAYPVWKTKLLGWVVRK